MKFYQSYNITPSNDPATKHEPPIAEIYVGSGGHIRAVGMDGTPVTFKNVPTGATLRGYFVSVMEEGTTAEDLIARTEWPLAASSANVTIAGS